MVRKIGNKGRVEAVEFNGKRYRRYPDSPHVHLQKYFMRYRGLLHRDVWEFHNGPIADGMAIHHKNGNTLDNDIGNLELVSPKQHAAAHATAARAEANRGRLSAGRDAAKSWHKSPEGRAWHRKNALTSIGKGGWKYHPQKRVEQICATCGLEYKAIKHSRFCGARCQRVESNKRHNAKRVPKGGLRACQHCGEVFKAFRAASVYCSKCRKDVYNKLYAMRRKGGV